MAYVIRRYANRKLYDVQASRYVTLDDLEEMIRAGTEVSVVDGATGDDITSVVLAQIILERARDGRAALPTAFLHQLVKYGEAWQDFMAKGLQATLEGIVASRREADQIAKAWAARAGLAPERGAPSPGAGAAPASGAADLRGEIAKLRAQVRALEERLPRKPLRRRAQAGRKRRARRTG